MGRSVYFAFHYDDVASFRANVVRKSSAFKKQKFRFKDSSIWEESKEKGPTKIKELIDLSLKGTSVTCVLVGTETYSRRYVRYEIVKSLVEKKGLVGVGINWIKDRNGNTKFWPGENPFGYLKVFIDNKGTTLSFFEYKDYKWIPFSDIRSCLNNKHFLDRDFGKTIVLSTIYKSYSYDWNNGKENFPDWLETAAAQVGR